jgi:Ca2+-binding RTX toxin-like protein
MEYQHGVFEEFGRTVQPFIDVLPANETGYHTDINAAITAEFAHVVYRFGHSMLTETLPRQGFGTADMSLLDGFLNPRAFLDDGNGNPLTPEQAAGSLAMGLTHHAGSGIDEFVTETLRNELLGLPLDLATINMMRGRDAGVPSFQTARATFYAATGDADLEPFANWQDFGFSMKHPESLVNFIAAYGTHPSIVAATTNADKRAAAAALVAADDPFLREPAATSGLNDVDFWIGGLAESIIPFGGMLGATFNFVFESQMEKLQNGDRFYYLSRNIGLNLLHQLEANSFSGMILRTTDATNIPADIFQTPGATIQLPSSDPDVIVENHADAPAAVNPAWASGHRYIGEEHVTIHGTGGDDRFRGGIGDDSLWGFGGDDHIVGGVGANSIVGGTGNDLLFGMGGDDNIKGGGGNDAIHGGSGEDLILGGSGSDFVFHGSEFTTTFGGLGDDFVLGSNGTSGGFLTGNEGDDWLEGQRGSQLLSGDNSNGFQNDPNGGHDVMLGGPGNDDMDSEGGDDIMVASEGSDRFEGMLGFDWVTYRGVAVPAVADMQNIVFQPPDVTNFRSRFDLVEGLSGWDDDDILRGYRRNDDVTLQDGTGHELTQEHLSRIANLRTLLGGGADPPHAGTFMVANPDSNIILGGAGSDIIEGRGGDNFIDGSAWLNVQLEWNGSRYDSMNDLLSGVFAGEIDPGDISIVREIVLDADQPDTINTAVFRDPEENYTITENDDGTTTVAHNGDFGTDTLRNIQRLQFGPAEAPEIIGLPLEVPPVNSPATGQPVIVGTAVENEELTVDTSAIADADGVGTFTFEWQVQDVDTGDWVTPASGNAGGPTFTPTFQEVGQNIRVVVSFLDGFVPPVNESVTSSAIGPVVACVGVGCGAPPVAPPAGDPPPPPPAPAPAPPAPPAPPASGPVVTTPLSTFTPLVPGRFLDTRSANATLDGLFSGSGTVPSNTIIEVQIAGRGNVPADATAVSMSVTAVTPSAAGFATVFPCGTPPNASNLNFADGQTVANSVTSLLSGSGSVCIFTSATSHFLIDVNGVVPPQEYTALVPGRFLDTRAGGSTIDGAAVGAGVVPAGTIVEVDIAGRGAVPADATAVSMNVTAVEAGAAGFATVFPCGTPPNASNINFTTGQTVANSVFTSLSTSGSVCVFTSAAAHYLIDVNGVFPATSTYVGTAPARFLDTRVGGSTLDGVGAGGGQVAAGTSIEIQVAGRGLVPPGATIASLNVTAVSPAAAGFATVYPCGTVPNASNLNVAAGQTVANGAMAMLSATGTVCIYTDVQAHYLVDVNGYVPG